MTIRPNNPRTERGIALVAALLFALTLSAFVASIIGAGTAMHGQTRRLGATQMAQEAAESGVHYIVAKLGGTERAALLEAGRVQETLRGTGKRALRFFATIEQAGNDGVDNDIDGNIDEADESDMLEVTSTGRYDGAARTVRVTLLARYETPSVPAATYFASPNAGATFNGNAFRISGFDIDLKGNPTGLVAPGIGVNGDPSYIQNQIKVQQEGNVIGSGGTPSVVQVSSIDMQELIEEGARSHNVALASGSAVKPENEGDWGTLETPAIVYGSGDVHISSGAVGSGLLIVNGSLTISGSFTWRGLLIVRGQVYLKGGGGTKQIFGSLVVEEGLVAEDPGGLTGSGNVEVVLSKAMVKRMASAFASFTVLNWREGPVPPEEALP